MSFLRIPHNACVFVGDGRKALVLRNEGDGKYQNLRVLEVLEHVNPPTHDQGTDRPGRVNGSLGRSHRSAVETTDWHDFEEHRFAERAAARMEQIVRERKVPALIIAAPPKVLADLRSALHADVRALVVAEIDKDLTKYPVDEIEARLERIAAESG